MDMKAHDTETTGLWWQHGTQAFLVGVYSTGGDYQQWEWEIDPRTRRRYPTHGTEKACEEIRESLLSGVSVFQNANFDLKAYAELGVIDWQEPCDKKFWDGIVELGHLTHLHSSQDCREGNSSLKVLTPKYLNRNYQSQDDLVSLVNQCRAFVRSRKPSWQINSDHCNLISVQPCKDKHNLADYWLPSAVAQEFSDVELLEYFGMDKQQMARVVGDYLYDDVKNTHDLAQFFLQQIPGDEMDQLAMNRDIAHVIWKMEIRGIAISLTDISTAMQTCQDLMDDYHQQTLEITGKEHSAWTPALLRNQLFEEWDMEPIAYTPKAGDPQVNSDCLGKLAEKASPEQSEFINLLLAWKKLDKKRQFLESYKGYTIPCRLLPANYPEKGAQGERAYPGYKATGTTTTRFSSYNPNQQQIEKPEEEREEDDLLYNAPSIRSLIKPRPGYGLYALDYSQLQLRIFAYLTEEEDLIQSFKDGWDFHDYMAHRIFDKDDINKHERRIAKNCFHPDTECLTKDGWKKIGDVDENDYVMQADPSRGRDNVVLSWTKPLALIEQQNPTGTLLHFKCEGRNLRVTPDHRMLCWKQKGNLRRDGKEDTPLVCRADEVKKSNGWSNAGVLYNTKSGEKLEHVSTLDVQIATMIQADGNFSGNFVRLGFTKKSKISRCRNHLNSAGIFYKERVYSGVTTFSVRKEAVSASLSLLNDDKEWCWSILALPVYLRNCLLKEIGYWDAALSKGKQTQTKYFSKPQRNRDVIQALATITGHKTYDEGVMNLSIKTRSWSKGGSWEPEEVKYNGKVVCVSVPSSYLVVRDGGIVTIQGNCNFGFVFGASAKKIEQTAGMDGLYDGLMEMFPNAHEFIQSTKEQIQATGLVRTMGGYPMSLPLTEDKYRPGTLSYQAHKGVNYRVQGTEGEIVKRAMVLCDQHLEFECPDGAILMQVHDEIVFEIPLTADPSVIYGLKDCMEEAARSFGVEAPVDIEFSDKNWALVKEWDGGVK